LSTITRGTLLLGDVRAALGAALAPESDEDPDVLPDLVDAISPPVLMLEWNDPWIVPRTVAGLAGYYDALPTVLCLASRLEPGPGVETLESLVAYALARLDADAKRWPVESSTAPRRFQMGGVNYLGARLFLRVPVSIGGSP